MTDSRHGSRAGFCLVSPVTTPSNRRRKRVYISSLQVSPCHGLTVRCIVDVENRTPLRGCHKTNGKRTKIRFRLRVMCHLLRSGLVNAISLHVLSVEQGCRRKGCGSLGRWQASRSGSDAVIKECKATSNFHPPPSTLPPPPSPSPPPPFASAAEYLRFSVQHVQSSRAV